MLDSNEVVFSQSAEKDFYKLEISLQKRIISSLERIRIRPYPHVKKLVGNPYFRLRVGDYRLILDIQDGTLVIFVIELGYRKNMYDSFLCSFLKFESLQSSYCF